MGRATDILPKSQGILEGFVPVYVHSLRVESVIEFDLYLYNGTNMVLLRASQLPFTVRTLASLEENRVARLYVSIDDRDQYQKYVRKNLNTILTDPKVDDFTKTSIVYDSAKEIVKDVMTDPTHGENIKASQELVESTVLHVLSGENAFHDMLRVMSFDYSLYSHSVNVCAYSLALAQASGCDTTQGLIELGTGALLHDVGKIKVPNEILFKRGPLEPAEFDTVRQHPNWGVELVRETDLIPRRSYLPIKQHHERQDGSGYPDGLALNEIDDFSRIVAIADAFDAMTTERVYCSPIESFSALRTMYDEGPAYDRKLLDSFARLMGPAINGNYSQPTNE